jgi:glucose/arabinose dehydrogenase
MTRRLMPFVAVAALAACGASPGKSSAQENAGGRPFTVTEVATFDAPWALAFLPGSGLPLTGMALVTEKGGKLWLVDTASGRKQEVSGVPGVKVAGQGGLGDVVAHPDFAGNQRIYLSFAEPGPGGTSGAALGYGRLILGQGAPRLEGFKVIWRQTPKVAGDGHFGHRLVFAKDGTMFLSSSDRQKMTPAQDLGSDLGKIVHLTSEGQPVPGPWAGRGGRAASYYSMGHRNVLGLDLAPDGRLWASEMGPQGGDEVNLILPGRNYGWPRASYGSHYGGEDIPDDHAGQRFEEPKVWWNPSISPAGLIIYTGDLFPQWKGDALIPALSGEAFIRVDVDGDKASKADQWAMNARIRAVDQGPRGEVYLLQDGDGAKLLRLEPAR